MLFPNIWGFICVSPIWPKLQSVKSSFFRGKKLIKKYDGEFPDVYFNEILDYLNIKEAKFFKILNKFRSPHLWKKIKNVWRLRRTVNKDGTDD